MLLKLKQHEVTLLKNCIEEYIDINKHSLKEFNKNNPQSYYQIECIEEDNEILLNILNRIIEIEER